MFWRLTALSASSPVESVLDKENFTLEELLDEEEIIQECKALNSRLINFLRDRAQVEQLLRYIVEEPPEDAESKRAFKFPFISCEIFTCEIDVILKTLVEEEELMNLLFSFLESNRRHSSMLAGYFSKVIVCLMIRKTVSLMNYVQAHQDVFRQLVDLIGITSIMEVLVRLVGADDHVYPNFMDVMQWLSESNLLEMIVDKLSPSNCPEVHGNAAETLSAVIRNAPSPLAAKLSSQSFIRRIFDHALEYSNSKSGLVYSLSVCISFLDPKRSTAYSTLFHSYRNPHVYERPIPVNPETIRAMLPKLGDLLKLLHVSSDENILPTPYGELRPPLGKHRLKIVEFVSVLLKTGNEAAEIELVSSGTIKRIIELFFEYPFNNCLHHHVESIILSCLESKSDMVVDHLLLECDLVGKFLQVDKNSIIVEEFNKSKCIDLKKKTTCPELTECEERRSACRHCEAAEDIDSFRTPTVPSTSKKAPRAGNIGHITRISNKIIQLGISQSGIHMHLQERVEWNEWQATSLQERNVVENVYRWACGRPTMLQERTRDSDEDDPNDRDYDLTSSMANNLNQPFGYNIYGNGGSEQEHASFKRDDGDVYFNDDDESSEIYLSALRLNDDKGSSIFTNSNWFAFEDDITGTSTLDISSSDLMDEINLNGTPKSGDSSSDDEVVVGEDDEVVKIENCLTNSVSSEKNIPNGLIVSDSTSAKSVNLVDIRPLPDSVGWSDTSDKPAVGSSTNPFEDNDKTSLSCLNSFDSNVLSPTRGELILSDASPPSTGSSDGSASSYSSQKTSVARSLFEEDVEFVGVEPEGTEKAMEQALKEGIVGEAGPLKRDINHPKVPEKENSGESESGIKEFNDANYWRVDQELTISE